MVKYQRGLGSNWEKNVHASYSSALLFCDIPAILRHVCVILTDFVLRLGSLKT